MLDMIIDYSTSNLHPGNCTNEYICYFSNSIFAVNFLKYNNNQSNT